MTNNLERRVFEDKTGAVPGFTRKYRITRLVYFEETDDVVAAIEREKHLKGWLRKKKIGLIESVNPKWLDLAVDWFTAEDLSNFPQLRCHPERSEGSSRAGTHGKILRVAQDDRDAVGRRVSPAGSERRDPRDSAP